MQPYHQHDSDITPYLGSEIVNGNKYDYYFSPQNGFPTVIARFGTDGDYCSGLVAIKSQLDKASPLSVIEQIENMKSKGEHMQVLATGTLLSIKQGFLDENLQTKTKKLKIK